mgnify:FL=1|jgi:hypothetical protein|tara:strand:+ start:4415 stop:5713 length:1299 start_codon:yes stop_codon:yes gene_type:complete
MKIHIIGAGPTGMSLAWEIIRSSDHEVTIYDRKLSAGGSWWEPEIDTRDLHAHRIVFDRAFINTKSLFNEMGISWDDIFTAIDNGEHMGYVLRALKPKDYGVLISLLSRVLTQPTKYKSVSLKDAVGSLSESGQACIEHLPLIMDGVTWDVMTAYEFVKNLDHVALSQPCTQKVSGKVMCDAMEKALLDAGANFVFGTELGEVEYGKDSYSARFSNGTVIDDGMLFLCLDNSPAFKLMGDNWGPESVKNVRDSTYGAINVLLDYENAPKLESDLEVAATTPWNLQPKVLHGTNTISCVICHLTKEIISTDPETLKAEVLKQLGVPEPKEIRIAWGAEWNGETWDFSQSSGVLSLHGQLPFFGKCPKVAMCGMMSHRNTPYSSIEAGVEVSRSLSHECFGTREPLQPVLLTQALFFILVLLIVLILVYRNRNQ